MIRVLVITKRDASNLFIENIIREFLRRKYEVTLFADFADHDSMRMFSDMGLQVQSASELTAEIAENYDFIFCAVQSMRDVFLYNRYVFSYYSMNPAIDPVRGGDFTFTWGEEPEGTYDGTFSLMPVGNPKNDTLASGAADSGRILFLDSGHFPFSDEGKMQTAQMLLDICARFPDREVWVKPRWLPGVDLKTVTHINTTHLYDCVDILCKGKRPKNLMLCSYGSGGMPRRILPLSKRCGRSPGHSGTAGRICGAPWGFSVPIRKGMFCASRTYIRTEPALSSATGRVSGQRIWNGSRPRAMSVLPPTKYIRYMS